MLKKWIFFGLFLFTTPLMAKPIHIVAAENFYGEVAHQIGGHYVEVWSILHNPNQNPHLFSANVATAKAIAQADILVYNGLNYDPWMENLISANRQKHQQVIVVSALVNKKSGDNPHIWYAPQTMLVYSKVLAQKLSTLDVAHQAYYHQQLQKFEQSFQPLLMHMKILKNRYQGTFVIATEPVFNEMAKALGLAMLGKPFQLSIMNDTAPSAKATKAFEFALRSHQAKVLIYNEQVHDPVTKRMQMLAKAEKIPLVGVSEMAPPHHTYVAWMQAQLEDLEKALSHGRD